jgi:hypothetical protein
MRPTSALLRGLLAASLVVVSRPAHAQLYEAVGSRAQGMGGAFVAVSDDASATWWNPAGLATGAYFGGLIERNRLDQPADPVGREPRFRSEVHSVAAAFPAMGVSYYRFNINEIRTPTGGDSGGRQEEGVPETLRAARLTAFGVTFGQSLGRHVVLGSTLRLIRAGAMSSADTGTSDPLGAAADLSVPLQTRGDIDLGVMLSAGHLRLGGALRHVAQPSFGNGADRYELARQGRVGMALVSSGSGSASRVVLAADADVTTTATAAGESQRIALGAEGWLRGRGLGVRAGVSKNTVGNRAASSSVGLSVALRKSTYVDGVLMNGRDRSLNGWGVSLRVAY